MRPLQLGAGSDAALSKFRNLGVSLGQQVTHLREFLGLRIQLAVGLAAIRDNLHQPGAALVFRHGAVGIQLFFRAEGALHDGFRVVHRAGELPGAVGTEFRDGQVQFFFRTADRLIRRGDFFIGAFFQRRHR